MTSSFCAKLNPQERELPPNKLQVGIINAGIGNIKSVERMLFKAGAIPILISTPSQLADVQKVILPGVGHFDAGMQRLKETGFDKCLVDLIKNNKLTVLGICLGMQLLCRQSEEGSRPGLGLVDATVSRIIDDESTDMKVPHMGWNIVTPSKSNLLLPHSPESNRFYFVHSFKVTPPANSDIAIGITDYGGPFCSAFQQASIFGVQFHPEKSHRFGLALMQRFINL